MSSVASRLLPDQAIKQEGWVLKKEYAKSLFLFRPIAEEWEGEIYRRCLGAGTQAKE
jgi:hypothetical protein